MFFCLFFVLGELSLFVFLVGGNSTYNTLCGAPSCTLTGPLGPSMADALEARFPEPLGHKSQNFAPAFINAGPDRHLPHWWPTALGFVGEGGRPVCSVAIT